MYSLSIQSKLGISILITMVCLFIVGVSAKSSLITNLAGVVLASLYPPFVYAFTSSALIRTGKPLSFHSVHSLGGIHVPH
jgi:hypothetical protein